MSPLLTTNDAPYLGLGNSEYGPYFPLQFAFGEHPANGPDRIVRENRFTMTFPTRLATFANHVRNVVRFVSKEKMVRTNARRIVAMMTDNQVIRYVAKVQSPRKTVGETFYRGKEEAVSLGRLAACPHPARLRLVNGTPKSNINSDRSAFQITLSGAVILSARVISGKLNAAVVANTHRSATHSEPHFQGAGDRTLARRGPTLTHSILPQHQRNRISA